MVGVGILGNSYEVYAGNGTFDVPEINDHFEEVKPGPEPQKTAPVTQRRKQGKEARDYWLNDSPMARGNAFNRKAVKDRWYPFHEIHLSNGKRLDSYDSIKGEIVSRKATDLDMLDIATFEKYLKELKNKYLPGMKIRSNK